MTPAKRETNRTHAESTLETTRTTQIALKFSSPRDFERGVDTLLDYGAVTALPNFVFLGSVDQIREASQQLYRAGVRFMTKSNVPPFLTREEADQLAAADGWESADSLTSLPKSRTLRTPASGPGDKVR